MRRAQYDPLGYAAIAIYVTAVVATLTVSAAFHATSRISDARSQLLIVDHAAIFFLIAGSYTPVHVFQFRGWMRWGVLTPVWLAAIAGILLKSFYFQEIPEQLGLMLYLGLGWVGLISAVALYRLDGMRPMLPLLAGALAYTLGAGLEFARVPTLAAGLVGPHEVFHLFVLAGVALHWYYIDTAIAKQPLVTSLNFASASLEFTQSPP